MLVQVTAYVVLEDLIIQATTARTTESGRSWEHRVLERVELAGCDPEDAWDLIWLVGQTLCDRALTHSRTARADNNPGEPSGS